MGKMASFEKFPAPLTINHIFFLYFEIVVSSLRQDKEKMGK